MSDFEATTRDQLFPNAGNVRDSFRSANPEIYGQSNGNLEAVRSLAVVETRAEALKVQLRNHLSRHEERWVRQEASRLMQKHGNPQPTLRPREASRRNDADEVIQQARRRVNARMTQRLTALNAAKVRLQNGIVGPEQGAPSMQQNRKQQLVRTFRQARGPAI